MIFAIHKKGRGFDGLMRYIFSKKKSDPQILGGTMMGDTVGALCLEAARHRRRRPGLKKAIFHASLRPGPEEKLSRDQMTSVAMEIMDDLGFARAPFVVCGHDDHIHIAAIRINSAGQTVSDSNDYARAAKSLQRLEKQYGLAPTAMTPAEARRQGKRAAPNWQIHRQKRTGERPGHIRLQELIDQALGQEGVYFDTYVQRLAVQGVETKVYYRKGDVSGMSYSFAGTRYKASQLGRNYMIAGLRKRGLTDNLTIRSELQQQRKCSGVASQSTPSAIREIDSGWRERSIIQRRYFILFRNNIAAEAIQDYQIWENKNGKFLRHAELGYRIWDRGDILILQDAATADYREAVSLMIKIAVDKGWELKTCVATGPPEFLAEVNGQINEKLRQLGRTQDSGGSRDDMESRDIAERKKVNKQKSWSPRE